MQDNSLYQGALADAKKLREVAEQTAKNAIIEAITPKIKQLIESQMGITTIIESKESDELFDKLMDTSYSGEVNRPDTYAYPKPETPEDPNIEEPEYTISENSVDELTEKIYEKVIDDMKLDENIELSIFTMIENINKIKKVANKLHESKKFNVKKFNTYKNKYSKELLRLYCKLNERNESLSEEKFNQLQELLETTNYELNKSLDGRINRIQDKFFKLKMISHRLDESQGSKLNAKFRQSISRLYADAVQLENKERINLNEVVELQMGLLEMLANF